MESRMMSATRTHTHTNGEFRTKRTVSPHETSWDTDGVVGLMWHRLLITHEQRRTFNSYGTRGPWAHRNSQASNKFSIPTKVLPMVNSKVQRRHLQMLTTTSHTEQRDGTRKDPHLNATRFTNRRITRIPIPARAWPMGSHTSFLGGCATRLV